MSELNTEFYEWVRDADEYGTIWRAVTEYYADSEYLYRVSVNGKEYTLPVLTTSDWLTRKSSLDSVLGSHNPEKYMDAADLNILQSRINRIAYRMEGDPDEAEIGDYIWNAERVKPILSLDEMKIDTGRSTYFSTLTQNERMVYELARGLYDYGVSPDADDETLSQIVPRLDLPERDAIARTLPELASNFNVIAAPLGVNVLTVVNTGGSYKAFIAERGEEVAVHPSRLSLLPAGGVELTGQDKPSIRHTVLREYGEELFSIPEGEPVTDHEAVQELQTLREEGKAHIDLVGIYIAARRLGVNAMVVLLIDDPEYYERHFTNGIEANWESKGTHQVALDDPQFQEYLEPTRCVPQHTVGAYEGLLHLDSEYSVHSSLDIVRKTPPQ